MRRKGRGKDEGRSTSRVDQSEHPDYDDGDQDHEEMDDETREMMEEIDVDETEPEDGAD